MSRSDLFGRLLASVHEAVLDDAHWPKCSALIDEACATKGNILSFASGQSQEDVEIYLAPLYYRGERRHDLERAYFDTYYPIDERIPRLMRLPDSDVVHVTDLYTEHELRTSAAYNENLPIGQYQNGINVRMDGPNGSRITWCAADPVDGEGWSFDRIEFIREMLPHFRQYVIVRQALVDADALAASALGLLDNDGLGVIHLDRRGRVVAANDRARAILRKSDGLTDRGGALHAALPNEDAKLQRMLARALPISGETGTSGSTMVSREHSAVRLVLHVSPVNESDARARVSRVGALVLVVDPASRSRIDADHVAAALGLTAAESHVATMLTEGKTIRDIAVATGRSPNTVKWHVNRVFAKVGVSRQADLVRLVLSLGNVPGM